MGRNQKPLIGWPYKILLMCRGGLSNIVFAIPLVAALKKLFPRVRLEWMVEPHYKPLLDAVKDLDEAVEYPQMNVIPILKPFKPLFRAFQLFFHFVSQMRKRKYATSIDIEDSVVGRWIAWLADVPLRIGRKGFFKCRWLNNYRIDIPTTGIHRVEQFIQLLSGWKEDIKPPSENTKFIVLPQQTTKKRAEILRHLGMKKKHYLVLHPGTRWESRKWNTDAFAEVAKYFKKKYGIPSLITWGAGERGAAWEILTRAGEDSAIIAPEMDILTFTSMLEAAAVVVAPDTGPLHLASILKVPTVGLFGPTNPEITGPYWGKRKVISRYPDAAKYATGSMQNQISPHMQEITPAEVVSAIEELIADDLQKIKDTQKQDTDQAKTKNTQKKTDKPKKSSKDKKEKPNEKELEQEEKNEKESDKKMDE